MALTPAQREAIERDLRALQGAQDALTGATVDAVSRAYGEALNAALVRVRRLVRGLKTDASGRLVVNLAAAASVSPTLTAENEPWRLVWVEWSKRLSQLLRLQLDYARRVGPANALWLGQERSALEALVGLWGEGETPTGGLALRFYSFSAGDRARAANAITQHILGGLPSANLERTLDELTPGATRRAAQLVQDGTMEVVRVAHVMKAESLGLEFFRYSGPDDAVTRSFCTRRVGKVYSRKEIDNMDNGQTGKGSVMTACGGYNCRHRWAGVDPEWYSETEWQEMRGGEDAATE